LRRSLNRVSTAKRRNSCFNGHPPLGVNATGGLRRGIGGGKMSFNGHPPLGVNATSGIGTGIVRS